MKNFQKSIFFLFFWLKAVSFVWVITQTVVQDVSCRPPLESEACLFEIEQCTTHCTVWVQVEGKAWNDKVVREGLIKI